VPFIPGKTLDKLNEREGWFFAWSSYRSSSPYRYAFAKLNKEVSEECQRRIDELRESFKLPSHLDTPQILEGQAAGESAAELGDDNSETATTSSLPDELRVKEEAIKSEYADREFHIFDVNSFFQELVKEGRPAPSPEVLNKLLELFAFLEKKDAPLLLMTPANLKSFLDQTHEDLERRRLMEGVIFRNFFAQ